MEKDSSSSTSSSSSTNSLLSGSSRSGPSTILVGAKTKVPSKAQAASSASARKSAVSAGTPYPPHLQGGKNVVNAHVTEFFTGAEQMVKRLLRSNKHVADDLSGRLSFVDFCMSDNANKDVGVLIKVSLARVLPTAFTDRRTDIEYYIKGNDYFSICTFQENGLDTVKEYEMLLTERLQRCMSAEVVEAIMEEVQESVSRYADETKNVKNRNSILDWRNKAILMIDEKIRTEMPPDSDSNYLPGAMLYGASTHEEKQNLLLNMLLLGAVKCAYPREVLEMFGVNCPKVREYVQQNYYGLLLLVRSLFSDLERAGSVQFRDDVIDQAKKALNMEHIDFERLLEEEDTELPVVQEVENLVDEDALRAKEILDGNSYEATQAVHYDGILHDAAEGLRSLQGVNLLVSAPDESFEDGASRELRDDALYTAFSKESADTQALTLETSPQDFAPLVLCAPKEDDIGSLSEDEGTESDTKKQKNR